MIYQWPVEDLQLISVLMIEDRKQKLIERLEKNLAEEKGKCELLEGKLKDCQEQIEKLQSNVKGHQREEQQLVEQICVS